MVAAASSVSIPCPSCKTKAKAPVNKISVKGIIYSCPNCKTKIRAARDGRKISARKASDDEIAALEPPPPPRKGKIEKSEAEIPAWVVTFADLATLLLTFFVLILSFSNMDVVKYRELVGSMAERFGVSDLTSGSYQAVSQGEMADVDSNISAASSSPREKLVNVVHDAVVREGHQGSASITSTDEGVRVRMKSRLLFKAGTAELNPKGVGFLDSVVGLLSGNKNLFLVVEGHTDSTKVRSAQYPSNWELSVIRASTVLQYLLEKGAPAHKLAAAGFADSRPLFSNDRPETRILNRRVEFLFKLG